MGGETRNRRPSSVSISICDVWIDRVVRWRWKGYGGPGTCTGCMHMACASVGQVSRAHIATNIVAWYLDLVHLNFGGQ
eukprot:scaffold168381_cov27-Tisochrysis_lutea.AAC.2